MVGRAARYTLCAALFAVFVPVVPASEPSGYTVGDTAREDITEEVIPAGDYLVEIGHYSYQGTSKADNKTPRSGAGRYMVLWRKDADGVWRLHRDIGNDAPKKSDAPTKSTKKS